MKKRKLKTNSYTVKLTFFLSGLFFALLVCGGGCTILTSKEHPVAALLSKLGGKSGSQELQEQLLSPDADLRREAVVKLGKGKTAKWEITAKMLGIMATGDPDEQVRVAAVRTLAKVDKGESLLEVLKQAAKDDSWLVRTECAEVLGKSGDDRSAAILLEMLSNDKNASVRGKVASVLKGFRDRKVIRGLVGGLTDAQFSVQYQSLQSLRQVTGQDFGYDQVAWQRWFSATSFFD